jgi:hypothetical protein
MSCDHSFIVHSCVNTKETTVWEDGNEYHCTNWKFRLCHTHFTLESRI